MANSHSHVAELAAVKSLYQRKGIEIDKLKQEMDKLKQKMEESPTSVAKVCSMLVVFFNNVLISWTSGDPFCSCIFSLLFQ